MFHLYIRKIFFTLRIIKHWSNLPRDTVEWLPMDVVKMQLDRVLDNVSEALLPSKIGTS